MSVLATARRVLAALRGAPKRPDKIDLCDRLGHSFAVEVIAYVLPTPIAIVKEDALSIGVRVDGRGFVVFSMCGPLPSGADMTEVRTLDGAFDALMLEQSAAIAEFMKRAGDALGKTP